MRLLLRLSVMMLAFTAVLVLPLAGWAQTPNASAKAQASSHWKLLSVDDKKALAPLAERWGEISDTQRSKWLTIAKNFDQLSPSEQQVMQARMKEWVALSPVQRNQARLNFNSVQGVSKDEKKSRWDEYQALSEEEKRKLSAGALGPAKTAAPSPKPAGSDRLVQPTVRGVPAAALPPRTPIDRHTLLPVPAPVPDPTPVAEPSPARETPAS